LLLLRPAPLLTAIAFGACLTAVSPCASAQTTAPKQQTPAQAQAEQHFQRAKVLYKAGNYREAIDELEKAHALDPAAKDLVLNLATVSEKIGRIDDALKYTHEYERLDLTVTEKEHADEAIRRLEGAKKQLDAQKAAQAAAQQQQQPPPPQPPPPEARPHGKIDVLTIGAATIAVAGYAVGTVFGVKALSDKPSASGYVAGTGPGASGTYADLQNSADHSHSEARVADIAFVVGGVATIGAAVLFFARTRDPKPAKQNTDPGASDPASADPATTKDETKTTKRAPAVHDAWLAPTIGGLMIGGSF
jgi:tetratricopeptide (TPR) repeat protein